MFSFVLYSENSFKTIYLWIDCYFYVCFFFCYHFDCRFISVSVHLLARIKTNKQKRCKTQKKILFSLQFSYGDFSKCGIQYFLPLIQTYLSNLVNVVIIFFITQNEQNKKATKSCLMEQLINFFYAYATTC